MINKLGHQAPKGYRINRFNSIEIEGDLHYCYSHNFVYNCEEEERKLYDGEPCRYTDGRFSDTPHNYFHNTYLHWTHWKDISLKACIRKTLQCKNIPVGTIISFRKSWYYNGKKIDNSYLFKIRKENSFSKKDSFEYEINLPKYARNFDNCEFSQKLTEALRANGFIVEVSAGNPNFLSSMLNTAGAYIGESIDIQNEEGQIAVAYGHGRKIGFSNGENSFRGYPNGCENILYDFYGEFDKWSRCIEIHKSTPIDEIIKILTDDKSN